MAKVKSVLVDNMEYCYECGSSYAECHHVFGGWRRKNSTEYKLHLPLCATCHKGSRGPHANIEKDLEYKKMAQRYYEEYIGSREEFILDFGKNYLWDEEYGKEEA